MHTEKFEVGNLVRLKSGGPTMTVERLVSTWNQTQPKNVSCSWFNSKDEKHTAEFHQDTLTIQS